MNHLNEPIHQNESHFAKLHMKVVGSVTTFSYSPTPVSAEDNKSTLYFLQYACPLCKVCVDVSKLNAEPL